MATFKKSFNNPHLYRQFNNNSSEMFDYTMSNIMDSFYDSAMNTSIDGKFKAVCLSGINTEDNTGGGTAEEGDAIVVGDYIYLIVRPLTPFGNILPDPADFTDPDSINGVISLHASTFLARSDFGFKGTSAINFGQVIECYFEEGSIANSDFRTLRFSEPSDVIMDEKYEELATIQGVESLTDKDWSKAPLLGYGDDATEKGKTSNTQGKRTQNVEYVVIHYSAAFGTKEAVLSYENNNTQFGYHYMIDRDGSYYQTADDLELVFHAGGNGTVTNSNSVGVCLMNVGYEREGVTSKSDWITGKMPNSNKSLKWEPYTESSLNTAAKICADLLKRHNLSTDRIVAHSDLQTEKQDPGPAFGMLTFKLKVYALMNQAAGA